VGVKATLPHKSF